jgi:osmotically-inducible protein OsmY
VLTAAPPREVEAVPDAQLASEMRARMAREPWVTNRGILVQARGGVLSIWGIVASEAERSAFETMARSIEGVKAVESHLLVKSEIPYHYGV